MRAHNLGLCRFPEEGMLELRELSKEKEESLGREESMCTMSRQ